MSNTLAGRLEQYEDVYETKILPRVPVLVKSKIRNYDGVCKKVEKPFCKELSNILQNTLLHTSREIDGAVFSFSSSGEFLFVLRNDLDNNAMFCKNSIQRVSSTVSSLLTSVFNKFYFASDDPPDLIGDVIFETKTFAVPSLVEVMNYLIWRQNVYNSRSVNLASYFELSKVLSNDSLLDIMENKNTSDKKEILKEYCEVEFDEKYPSWFRNGFAAYKAPIAIISNSENLSKKRWIIDNDISSFFQSKEFVMNILHSGQDLFNPSRDLVSNQKSD